MITYLKQKFAVVTKMTVAFALVLCTVQIVKAADDNELIGAGSSFAYPVYSKWAISYEKATGTRVNYQSVGSGAGVKQIKAGLVAFGASDYPLSAAELKQYHLVQIPALAGGIVLAVNLGPDLNNKIVLSGPVIAQIYMGKITKWNDPQIEAINPGLKLPNIYIAVLFRSDASGTTYNFTKYLAQVYKPFYQVYGYGKSVNFPVGLGGKGNEGVAAVLPRVYGSIGYLEYGYAESLHGLLGIAKVRNELGQVIEANPQTLDNGIKNANWNDPVPNVANVNSPNTWPINAVTFVLVSNKPEDLEKRTQVYNFFKYGMLTQEQATRELDYVPIANDIAQCLVAHLAPNNLKPKVIPHTCSFYPPSTATPTTTTTSSASTSTNSATTSSTSTTSNNNPATSTTSPTK